MGPSRSQNRASTLASPLINEIVDPVSLVADEHLSVEPAPFGVQATNPLLDLAQAAALTTNLKRREEEP